jgi:hypothetical protein
MIIKTTGGRKPLTRRAKRYGKTVRGWDWRAIPELLDQAEAFRLKNGMERTELLERALSEYLRSHSA